VQAQETANKRKLQKRTKRKLQERIKRKLQERSKRKLQERSKRKIKTTNKSYDVGLDIACTDSKYYKLETSIYSNKFSL